MDLKGHSVIGTDLAEVRACGVDVVHNAHVPPARLLQGVGERAICVDVLLVKLAGEHLQQERAVLLVPN